MKRVTTITSGLSMAFASAALAGAATIPFTETFSADSAGWYNGANTAPATWVPTGGADGAYITESFNFVNSTPGPQGPVFFRGQDENNASGGAFVGDWISEGVTEFHMRVRHNAPTPVNFFARFSGPFNFPGATAVAFAPVLPDVWTDITIAIDAANPQFVSFEGSDFDTVFGDIGHVQVGVGVPAGLAGVDQLFSFDLDTVSIVPEPASLAMAALMGLIVLPRRGR